MGRLFWKFIFAFWLAFAAISLTVASALWMVRETHSEAILWGDRFHEMPRGPALFLLDTASAILQAGSVDTLRATLSAWQHQHDRLAPDPQLFVFDDAGRQLIGRGALPAPSGADSQLRRTVSAADGRRYTLVLVRTQPHPHPPPAGLPSHEPPPPPFLPILAAIVVSLGFSAWLAWYMAKPIRVLRWAFRAVAEGRLDTRVRPLMGRRRDEVADLGRDFDRMAGQLQAQIESQQRLLHDVSHELRSPLARLQAAIGIARRNPGRLDMTLARIEHESAQLDALVGEVLTLARMGSGSRHSPREPVDLVELLESIVDDARFEAQAMGREVSLVGEGRFVLACHGELLYRSFENVIRNAVKYTADRTAVDVAYRVRPDALTLTVTDRGPGVPAACLDRIFEPFFRTDSSRSTEGFGLGLAIARRAVEAHDGTILAEAAPGGGLRVSIRIPRPPAAAARQK